MFHAASFISAVHSFTAHASLMGKNFMSAVLTDHESKLDTCSSKTLSNLLGVVIVQLSVSQ